MHDTILVAVDLAKPARAMDLLTQAQELCAPDGLIRVLHVLPRPVTDAARARAMARLLGLGGGHDPRIMPVLREGDVAAHVQAMAQADAADMILLASHLPGMADFDRDTTAPELTRHSTIPVLVARSPAPERTIEHV